MEPTIRNDRSIRQTQHRLTYAILVVHEDPADLAYYCALLQNEGYYVQASSSYEEALGWLGSRRFDFIIVSQGTREFEGRCVLERAIELDRRLPVLVVADRLDFGCYLEAIYLGALDYFEKPFMSLELLRLVKSRLPAQTHLECAA